MNDISPWDGDHPRMRFDCVQIGRATCQCACWSEFILNCSGRLRLSARICSCPLPSTRLFTSLSIGVCVSRPGGYELRSCLQVSRPAAGSLANCKDFMSALQSPPAVVANAV